MPADTLLWCFGSLMIGGFAYLLLSLLVGEVSEAAEGLFENLDSLFEGIGLDLLPEIGAETPAGKGIGCSTIAAFITGFGITGFASSLLGAGVILSIILSFLAGGVFGALYIGAMSFLYKQQATSTIEASDFEGLSARVTINIPAGEIGQVALTVGGQQMTYPAVEVNRKQLFRDESVKVIRIEGGRLLVEKP